MDAAQTIIQTLLDAPKDKQFGGKIGGSGPHARPMPTIGYQKIVIPGDAKSTTCYMVYLLLHDLSVDLGLPEDVREALRKQFREG